MDDPKPCGIFRNLFVISRQKGFFLAAELLSQSVKSSHMAPEEVGRGGSHDTCARWLLARSLTALCAILIMVKPLEIASGGRKLRRITY